MVQAFHFLNVGTSFRYVGSSSIRRFDLKFQKSFKTLSNHKARFCYFIFNKWWLCLRFVWWFVFIKFIEWMLYNKMYFEVRCSKMIEMFLIVIVVPPYNWFCSLGYRLKTLLSISEKLGKLCLCSLNLQLRNVRVLPWLPLQDPLKLFLRMLLLELRVKGRWKCIIHQNKCNR